ncbi:succinate dehydrogenase / fumarate reductase cytochrome b subunit [Micromonospora pattaloongensis]|uniref:Succinate dehydrogenase / fumarate reductase cytochrome b subunit n=1 Tax=Micromonospora pattaloongensis TaxID=405436 RepID=A0A1H3JB93_9ACTN|nr:succinate dehydrogenase cytochrome b subunit [Micromonospora pattaloongensis]SDY37280.1 succinate dehydrogenase / fumarate reductase cytochrome b subunit [Micromonospora pattaloongensis]
MTASPIRSTVGKKILMAVTGILLVLFLVLHMVGNLKIFFGAESFDHYAHWLRSIGNPLLPETWFLWIQRAVLTFAVLGHIWAATALALRARAARPVRYAHRGKVQGSYAARTMRWGGVIILLFVIYHILDLTTGHLNPVGDKAHPYGNVVADFAPDRWYVTLFYTLAVVSVGFHLRHGLYSALRTLGQQTKHGERRARAFALGFAVVLCAGYLSVPFAVLTGLVG